MQWLSATVTLTINPINDTPVAQADAYQVNTNTILSVTVVNGVLDNDTDVDQDVLQAVLVDNTTNGLLILNGDGSFDYTPNTDFVGSDSFTYRAGDGILDSLATVVIDVTPAVDPDDLVILPLDEGSGTIAGDIRRCRE